MDVMLKNRGNDAFAKGKLNAAIELYSEAISLNQREPTFYTNRALCFVKKGQMDKALSDCDKALILDNDLVKAHYLKGMAMAEGGRRNEGVGVEDEGAWRDKDLTDALVHMERALDLCNMGKNKKKNSETFVNEIRDKIKATLKTRAELRITCRFRQIRSLKEEFMKMARIVRDQAAGTGGESEYKDRVDRWEEFFESISPKARVSAMDVPDFLQCKITMDVCADPCVAPSGVTYDRGALERHLAKSPFDPVTREPLTADQIYPNLALKEAINQYYEANPWADDLEYE